MPPSTTWAPMCCCSKNTRRKQYEFSERGDITIRVNGKEHLTVHRVALQPSSTPSVPRLQGVSAHSPVPSIPSDPPCSSRSDPTPSSEDFATARTSRELQIRHVSMAELMREVREEAGLPVTTRDEPTTQRNNEQPLSVNELLLEERRRQLRKAVFNEEGDISSRTFTPKQSKSFPVKEIPKTREERRHSTLTITVEETIQLPTPGQPSAVRKYVSAAPEVIMAVFAFSYAWITGILSGMFR